jgi:hypothetical protein
MKTCLSVVVNIPFPDWFARFQASCRLAEAEGVDVAPAITRRKWAIVRAVKYVQECL